MDRYVLVVIVGILGFIYSGANAAIAEQKIDDKIVGERIGKVIDSIKSDKFMPCSNGSFWMSLDPKHKRSFLNGFFDGVLGSEMWCKMSLENSVDYKNDMAKKFSPEMNIMDLIQSLDDEYKSNDNLYYDIYGTIISKNRTISSIPDESTLKYMKTIDPKQFENPEFMKQLDEMSKVLSQNLAEDLDRRKQQKIHQEKISSETGYDKLFLCDGFFWNTMSYDSKLVYILGVHDGILMSFGICEESKNYREVMFKAFYNIKKIRDMIDALDQVYQDVANRNIPIDVVLALENQRSGGIISSNDKEILLRDFRQTFH